MNAKQLNQLLVNKFPKLEEEYHKEVDWQEGDETGSHVVYGDVFAPYIEKIVAANNQEELKRVFIFIEEILLKNEKYSDEVIMFSILERILCDEGLFQNCREYFGKCTEKVVKEMQ